MSRRDPDVVTASEIATWGWCPESWRLSSLGHEPENRAALERGQAFHESTAAFEGLSRVAISLGRWLLVAAAGLVALAVYMAGGG